jgi:hypothetical protein
MGIIMAKRLNLPDDLHDQFQQLLKLAPDELQNNVAIQNILSVYLKFGGEKLARHGLTIIHKRYLEEKWLRAQESQETDPEDSEIDASEDLQDDDTSHSESDDLKDDDSDDAPPD